LINILCNFAVYCYKISYVSELKTRLINEWAKFDHSIVVLVDAAISQWRRCLNACGTCGTPVCVARLYVWHACTCGTPVRVAHVEHKFWQLWHELLYEIRFCQI